MRRAHHQVRQRSRGPVVIEATRPHLTRSTLNVERVVGLELAGLESRARIRAPLTGHQARVADSSTLNARAYEPDAQSRCRAAHRGTSRGARPRPAGRTAVARPGLQDSAIE